MADLRPLGTPASERERRVCERSFVGAVVALGQRCWRVQVVDHLTSKVDLQEEGGLLPGLEHRLPLRVTNVPIDDLIVTRCLCGQHGKEAHRG